MHEKYFYAPVTVTLKDGGDLVIASLSDMASFLQSWVGRRGKLYDLAVKACEAAQKGYITMDQTRRTLVSLAEATGRLRRDLEPETVVRPVTRGFGGFAA